MPPLNEVSLYISKSILNDKMGGEVSWKGNGGSFEVQTILAIKKIIEVERLVPS